MLRSVPRSDREDDRDLRASYCFTITMLPLKDCSVSIAPPLPNVPRTEFLRRAKPLEGGPCTVSGKSERTSPLNVVASSEKLCVPTGVTRTSPECVWSSYRPLRERRPAYSR